MRPPSNRRYLRVGVTGGIGSGKSTVCGLFAELGRAVVSADEIAHAITETDHRVIAEIRRTFGKDIYERDGHLARKRLAAIVFASATQRKKLDAIVHPQVFLSIDQRLAEMPEAILRPYVIIEAALIFESGLNQMLDHVIVVDALEETRIQRVMKRDTCSRDEVLQRIQSQMPAATKVAKADFVLLNEQQPAELSPKVAFIDSVLRSMVALQTE